MLKTMKTAPASLLITPLFAHLIVLSGCSIIVDIDECEDNSQCVLEDGTELVCGVDNTCIEAPALGETCLTPRECLQPTLCVTDSAAPADESPQGVCAMDCSLSSCEGVQGVPEGWVCCELSDGAAACLPPEDCGS